MPPAPTTPTRALTVHWTMTDPPIAATAWHAWSDRPADPSPDAPATEAALSWPPATLAVLHAAFASRLPRTSGWEVAPSLDLAAAVTTAARVYKRGVATRTGSATAPAQRQLQGRYDIVIDDGPNPPAALGDDQLFYVVDGHVAAAWPPLAAIKRKIVLTLSEHEKTLASTGAILAAWRAAGSPRRWATIGGGLLTDVAAFAACLAGAEVEFLPTTLLAMADACVGGKTGVNFAPFGKNQVGAFYFPTAVHVWTGWLSTLPPRELRAGGAECLKHAFLMGDLALARDLAGALAKADLARLARHLPRVIGFKADVVAEDPTEIARRATLNLGHTLAHALEAVSQARTRGADTILHGEAVGVGMAYALLLSVRAAGLPAADAAAMLDRLGAAGCLMGQAVLARRLGVASLADSALFDELYKYVGHDKKNATASEASQWILLAAPGRVARAANGAWTIGVPRDALVETWRELSKRI